MMGNPGVRAPAPVPVAAPSSVSAIDGDTLRQLSGPHVRLWGIDAPELHQTGFNPQGVSVPVGQQSAKALADLVKSGPVLFGAPQGISYGRTVAPVAVGGQDAGANMLRYGNALAAPQYLAADQARRFQYLQDERLARVNRLGPVGSNAVENPAAFRAKVKANPDYVTPRETAAQFWDTPTPVQGMRPEVEQEFNRLLNDPKVPAEEVAQYARDHGGFVVDPAEVAKAKAASSKRKQPIGFGYAKPVQVLTDAGDGAGGAAVRGYGQGFMAGGLDEAGAVADTLIPYVPGMGPPRENVFNSDRRFADIWANNEAQNASILGYDQFAHPYASTGGEVAGAITSGLAIPYGQGARTVPELARVGGVYGGFSGFLGTDGSVGKRLEGAAVGVPVGMAAGAGLGKAIEVAAPVVGKVAGKVFGKGAQDAARGVGESVREVADDGAQNAAQGGSGGQAGGSAAPVVLDGPALRAAASDASGAVDMRKAGEHLRNEADAALAQGHSVTLHVDGKSVPITRPGLVDERGQQWGAMPVLTDNTGANRLEVTPGAGAADIPPPPEGFTLDHPRSVGMDAEPMPSISGEVRQPDRIDLSPPARPQRMDQPLSEAQRSAFAQDMRPGDVLPLPSNEVASVEEAAARDAGRFAPAKVPNERKLLDKGEVVSFSGRKVPKTGPIDLVEFLRLRGGLKPDDQGELASLGIVDNSARRGMDFVGQEARFGPMLNDKGMDLDDAALAAWEHGYFPESHDRPDVNTFLEALGETYNGGHGRRFLPEDMGTVEDFHARQADRYALEQQQAEVGGPVYVDRSSPADEPQPFPPAEAYDDRMADTAKRAGNLNLDKLDTPQDIRRALVQTERSVGFDAATRGKITQAETERLASDLNMTPEQLLSRRKGQALNAEEALAARQILAKSGNELVNLARKVKALDEPGDELLAAFRRAWMRHVAIQEQVSGATAEAGRALQQFRMAANSREVRGDVLASIVRGGGGKDNLQDAAQVLLDAVESGPGVFNTVADKAAKPKFASKVMELYINSLLSGPQTHAVNIASNTLTAIAQIPEHATGALIGGARRAVSGGPVDRVMGSEVGARAFGLLQGAREGARLFAQALRRGEASDFASKVEGEQFKAIGGLKGEVVRVPTRLLTAEDEFFKGIARRMELNAQAVRLANSEGLKGAAYKARIAELVADPTDAMFERALDYGRYLTFQRKLGPLAQKVSALTADSVVAKVFLPFVRTPTNLLKFAAERSPIAPLLKEWRGDWVAGGARRDMAIARMMLGTGFGAAIYEGALSGHITGSQPSDDAKSRLLSADHWQPYSIKLNGKWYSYKRLDPFSTTIGVAADLATLPEGMSEKQREDKTTLLVASIMGNLASKTWLSGLSDLTEALSDPGRYADNLERRLVASFVVPNLATQIAHVSDPYRRKRDSVGDEIRSRVPGLSEGLLPQRDIWGQPVPSGENLGPDLLSPVWMSQQKNDPVNAALLPLDYSPGYPDKAVHGRELSPQEYDRFSELSGKLSHERLSALVTFPGWRGLDPEQRVKLAKKTVDAVRDEVRSAMFGGDTAKVAKNSVGFVPPPPPGFSVEGEAAGRNVFADLQRAIPGLRVTSGFRTPAYQQGMKARGYHPADNSGHLSGSDLDLLPPPGKSLGWLSEQVKKLQPAARLLNEGDHLHAHFPGYYGAPPIGGAAAAGLHNPFSGMPPPPPGFTIDGGR